MNKKTLLVSTLILAMSAFLLPRVTLRHMRKKWKILMKWNV